MTGGWKAFGLAVALVAVSGCEKSYDDQAEALYAHVGKNRIGSSPDYYLVKGSGFGGPERVGLVYAMIDDFQFCIEIAEFYMERYPGDRYTCEKAN